MMELTSEQHLIRLAAEAFAVLTPTQMKAMAASMDLEWTEVYALFEDEVPQTIEDGTVPQNLPKSTE